jgi:hypothetical protein
MSVRMLRRATYAMLGLSFVACADSSPTGPGPIDGFSSSSAQVTAGRPVVIGDTARGPRVHPCRDRQPDPRCRWLNNDDRGRRPNPRRDHDRGRGR